MTKDPQEKGNQNSSSFVLSRAIRWLKKFSAKRNGSLLNKFETALPFYCSKANFLKMFFLKTFVGYQPDSHAAFCNHPEFDMLFRRFTMHNKSNNAGDVVRLWSFILNIKQILSENIEGDFAELGVWRGNTASVLAHFASKSNRQVYLFDTYEGFNKKDIKGIDSDKKITFENTSIKMVSEVIGEDSKVCDFVKGYFPGSIAEKHKLKKYAVVSLDCDLYEPMKTGLDFFYPLMPCGALFLLHDYSSLYWAGSKKAIDEFCEENQEYVILMPDKSGSAFIRKSKLSNTLKP